MTNPRAPRWTADTEIAFLMALRLLGSPTAACAAIGRSAQGTYKRRRECPDFAKRWEAVTDELIRARAQSAPDVAAGQVARRLDGLSAVRRRAFLRVLGDTGRYDRACAHIRVSVPAITKLRARDPEFARQCEAALGRSTATLEQAAIERAVEGVEEPIYHAGTLIGTRRRYSDPLLKFLLAREDHRAANPPPRKRATQEETDTALSKKLDALALRLQRKAREEQALIAQAADGATAGEDAVFEEWCGARGDERGVFEQAVRAGAAVREL